jgi:predicted transcriptional regulator
MLKRSSSSSPPPRVRTPPKWSRKLAFACWRDARNVEGVNRGIAAADRGELIEHAEVVKRIEQLFRP